MIAVLMPGSEYSGKIVKFLKSIVSDHEIKVFDSVNEMESFFPCAIIVSVLDNNTHLIESVKNSDHFNTNTLIFLIGERKDQAIFIYTYQCDGFILISRLKADLMNFIKKINSRTIVCSELKAVTFGRFELYYKGLPVNFYSKKAKELFALCVDHKGTLVTIDEAADKLWPERFYDENVKQLYRKAAQKIQYALEKEGLFNVFIRHRGSCCINQNLIKCDLFDFLNDPVNNNKLFNGSYMFDYTWAEYTLSDLEKIAYKNSPEYLNRFV